MWALTKKGFIKNQKPATHRPLSHGASTLVRHYVAANYITLVQEV